MIYLKKDDKTTASPQNSTPACPADGFANHTSQHTTKV